MDPANRLSESPANTEAVKTLLEQRERQGFKTPPAEVAERLGQLLARPATEGSDFRSAA